MDTSFILLILGFLVVTYLIFKFIKKIVVAVFSFIFLIILIIGSVVGLAALDVNNLASQSDFNVNVFYGSVDKPVFGLSIPVVNKSVDQNSVSKYDINLLKSVDLEKEDKNFYIFYSRELFANSLSDSKNYYLMGTKDLNILSVDINASLTKSQVIEILNDNSPIDKYVDVVYNQNKVSDLLADTIKSMFKEEIQSKLDEKHLDLEQALFVSVLMDVSGDNNFIVSLINGFKSDELQVYPDRFTFKLVKMLPVDTIIGYIPADALSN